MKTKLLFAAFAALLTAGCSQNEIMEVSPDAAPAVGFKVFTDAQTRGTVTNSTSIQSTTGSGFGVFAYHTKQSAWNNAGSFTPNFMYNQKVEYKSSAWEYTPVKYWPNTEGDKISFFAYAPHNSMESSGITFTTTTTAATGAPKLNFTLQNTPLQMVDLVATNAAQTGNDKTIDRTKTTGKVAFNLKHVLTRASFKAKLETSLASSPTHVFITGMRILGTAKRDDPDNAGNSVAANAASKFYNAGIYQWSDGTWSTTGLTVQAAPYDLAAVLNKTAATGVTNYTEQSIELPQAATATSLFKSSHYLFLIPPANNTGIGAATDVRVQLDYDIVTVDNNLAQKYSITSTTATVSLPNGTLKLGAAYEFTFTVGLEKVQVSASVTDWATTPTEVSIPSAEAASNAAAIVTAIGTLNTAKASDRNCNYFIVNCSGMSGLGTLNLSTATVTNFASGDKIELNFATNPGVTSLTLPSGWKADKTNLSAAGKIILTKD